MQSSTRDLSVTDGSFFVIPQNETPRTEAIERAMMTEGRMEQRPKRAHFLM